MITLVTMIILAGRKQLAPGTAGAPRERWPLTRLGSLWHQCEMVVMVGGGGDDGGGDDDGGGGDDGGGDDSGGSSGGDNGGSSSNGTLTKTRVLS